jgi:antitoxin component of MazEF toxin-antitoxin module
MKPIEIKVARIGNSRGVRLPAGTLERYNIGETVIMEERLEGILLRPTGPAIQKLSWEETARQMVDDKNEWKDWDSTSNDGLEDIPWESDHRKVAEDRPDYSGDKSEPE